VGRFFTGCKPRFRQSGLLDQVHHVCLISPEIQAGAYDHQRDTDDPRWTHACPFAVGRNDDPQNGLSRRFYADIGGTGLGTGRIQSTFMKNDARPRVYDVLAQTFAQEEVRICFALLGDAAVWDFHVSDKVVSPTIRRAHPRPGGERK
jgi:hypothetical protein